MPIGILDWQLRDNGGELGQDRGWVLVLLYMFTNPRGRCFPSMDAIAKGAGCGRAKAIKIIDWLEEHGAIIKVPYKNRELEETKLHQRKIVYQLTGIVCLKKGWITYLRVDKPEEFETLLALVGSVCENSPFKSTIIEHLKCSKIERLIIEHEGTTGNTKGSTVGGKRAPKAAPKTPNKPLPEKPVMDEDDHAKQLISAWAEVTDEKTPPNPVTAYRFRDALQLVELKATPEEITGCTQHMLPQKRKGCYLFKFLLDDLPVYRMHMQEVMAQKRRDEDTAARMKTEGEQRRTLVMVGVANEPAA